MVKLVDELPGASTMRVVSLTSIDVETTHYARSVVATGFV